MSRLYEGSGVGDGRERIVCYMVTERKMGGVGAFVRRQRSGGREVTDRLYEGNEARYGRERIVCTKVSERGWEGTERMYGAVGENSIDFQKILYRLFRKTL